MPPGTRPRHADADAALDRLQDAAIEAGMAGGLSWWRVVDILHHLDQVDWLAEHDISREIRWPAPRWSLDDPDRPPVLLPAANGHPQWCGCPTCCSRRSAELAATWMERAA